MPTIPDAVTDSISNRLKTPFLAAYAAALVGYYWKGLTVLLTAEESGQERVEAAAQFFHFGIFEFLFIAGVAISITLALAVLNLTVSTLLSILREAERVISKSIKNHGTLLRIRLDAGLAEKMALIAMEAEASQISQFAGSLDIKRSNRLKAVIEEMAKMGKGLDGNWIGSVLPAIVKHETVIHVNTELFKGLSTVLESAPFTHSAVNQLIERLGVGSQFRKRDPA